MQLLERNEDLLSSLKNLMLMIWAEAAEKDANDREQRAAKEARQRERDAYALTFG
ncbi:hypothetical protein GJ744_007224 [Endocarpon pusillum]|uniref:Uncharacterized protein n=1 Tax=Endocarpon pusillum TaxID=364733 RepID=A0A8H7DY77_9EURO|nr:hypothetical protein GJ744_007224 [Endocarpon pusillum]